MISFDIHVEYNKCLPAEVEGGWARNVEYMTWRSNWGVEHWSRGTGLRPAIGTDLAITRSQFLLW